MSRISEETVKNASEILKQIYDNNKVETIALAHQNDEDSEIRFLFDYSEPETMEHLKPFLSLFEDEDKFYTKNYGGFTLGEETRREVKKQLDELADIISIDKYKSGTVTTTWYQYVRGK